jgi:hypothetical protein
LFVDVTAGIDVIHSRAFWIFESIDPATGLPPEDPLVGMLPVKDSSITYLSDSLAVDGEGFVNFTIKPKTNSLTGDEVLATAEIVFDLNDTIPTNVEHNTIDAFPPVSFITATPVSNNSVLLQFNATDDGSGVRSYDLFISQDSLNYNGYLTGVTDSFVLFTGLLGSQYHFFTLATDNTGNREALKSSPDFSVTFLSGCSTIVTNTNASGEGSLLEAVNCAVSGSTLTFASALIGQTITLDSGEIMINKDLTISGPGMLNLTLSGNNTSRIFYLPAPNLIVIKNLSMKNANSPNNGGALLVEGNLTLENVILQNNFENTTPKPFTLSQGAFLSVSGIVEIRY